MTVSQLELAEPVAAPGRSSLGHQERLDCRFGIRLVIPGLLVIIAILPYTVIDAFWMSMHSNAVGPFPVKFIGLRNYGALLHDPTFIGSVDRSLYFTAFTVIPGVVIGLALAMLLTKDFRGKKLARILILVPWAMPEVATGITWHLIYSPTWGILNWILMEIGLINQNIVWTGTQNLALACVSFAQLWACIPFLTLLFIAGLQRVPASVTRAARIDGAGPLRRFTNVTLPAIRYPLVFACLVQTMWSLRVFGVIYVLTDGGPANGTTTLNWYAYEQTFSFLNFGTGASIAIVIAAITLLATSLYMVILFRPQRHAR